MSSAKEYFGTDFVKKIYEMFERAEQEGKFVFMHGTYSFDDAINIALNGLECDYPELLYTAELMNIVTKKSFRANGIGKLMLEYLINMCKNEKIKTLNLEVNSQNTIAINLYKKYNFKEVGLRKKYYNNTYDAILMSLNF